MDEERYYSNPPENNSRKGNSGTAPMVCGLISIISALTVSRLLGLILGIVAVTMGGKLRHSNSDANAGYIMGIIGICLSAAVFLIVLFLFLVFAVPMFFMW